MYYSIYLYIKYESIVIVEELNVIITNVSITVIDNIFDIFLRIFDIDMSSLVLVFFFITSMPADDLAMAFIKPLSLLSLTQMNCQRLG